MITLDLKIPNFLAEAKKKYRDLVNSILATVQTNRGMLFDKEGAHNGHQKWKGIRRKGQILSDTGNLRRSIAPPSASGKPGPQGKLSYRGGVITIGSNVKYAAIHNYGGVIVPKTKKVLRFKMPDGKWVSKKSVVIPKRPFLGGAWNDRDQQELDTVIAKKIKRIIDEAKT